MRSIHVLCSTLAIPISRPSSVVAFTTSFVSARNTIRTNNVSLNPSLTMMPQNSEFEDFQNSDESTSEGRELARQFYQQVEKRKQAKNSLDEEQYDLKNDFNDSKDKNKKFTGRRGEIDSTGTPSAGLFARGNGSVYAFPVEKRAITNRTSGSNMLSPKEKMIRNEINFMNVASSEVTILLQGLLVIVLLLFAVYVGISGGITDGSERFGVDDSLDFPGLLDDRVSSIEVVKENSVWL
mmetsp:Transcript_5524/g.10515  ORF Transcript_5524/g.10515 Transcript_5524/m.10515 type:complete len:238 (+) Transcript_5524:351-1064(+)